MNSTTDSGLADDKGAFAKRVARSFIYSGVGNVFGRVIALLGLGIGIALLTKEEWGAARYALSVLAIVRAITEAGLGVALVQARKATREQLDSLFWVSLMITLGAYAVIFFGFAPLADLFFTEVTEPGDLARGMCLSVALYTFYFIPRAFMERELQLGRLVIIDNVSLLFGTVLLAVTASKGYGAWSFVYFEVGQRACQAILSLIAHPFMPKPRLRFGEIRKMFNFAMYATGSRLLFNFYSNVDFLIVAKFFGEATLGVYAAAWHILSEPIRGLAIIVNQVAYPAFARLQDDLVRLRSYFFAINRASFAFIGSVLGLVVVFSGPAIRTFDKLRIDYEEAIPLIWIFASMGILKAIAPLVPQLLNAVGKARLSFFYSLACAIVLPIAFVIGAQSGLRGVVIAWVTAYPVVVLLLFYFGSVALEIKPLQMIRVFAGIRVAGPVFAIEIGLYYLLHEALAISDGWTAAIGAPLSLVCAVLVSLWAERHNIAALRAKGKAKSEAGERGQA